MQRLLLMQMLLAQGGDKARERMREQLSIEREFLEKREDLQRRYQSGDIRSQEDYDRYNRGTGQSAC